MVDIGDFYDMPSLCSYDKGTKGFEGRRYKADIAAGNEAQDRLLAPIRKAKKKLPRFVRTLGNHEDRISRAVDRDPVLEGTIGLSDLLSKEYHWEEYPFREIVDVDGIDYSHYFVTGTSGRPVSGEHPAHMLLTKRFKSSTMGHDHRLDFCVRSSGARKLYGLICGNFQDYHADYANQGNSLWSRGVVIKRNVEQGQYDFEWVSMKRLKEVYGS